jgi:hypothetical protein
MRCFVSADHFNRGLYTSSQTRERVLNRAIVQAEISESFEEYLEIFDAFYADDIEVSTETQDEPIRGKARVCPLLLNFLVPLHAMAEVGGLSISIRESTIPGDAGETHSAWPLDLLGMSGRTCTLSWRTLRNWNGSRVVYEHHYDQQQSGGPLTFDDLSFNAATSVAGIASPIRADPAQAAEYDGRDGRSYWVDKEKKLVFANSADRERVPLPYGYLFLAIATVGA